MERADRVVGAFCAWCYDRKPLVIGFFAYLFTIVVLSSGWLPFPGEAPWLGWTRRMAANAMVMGLGFLAGSGVLKWIRPARWIRRLAVGTSGGIGVGYALLLASWSMLHLEDSHPPRSASEWMAQYQVSSGTRYFQVMFFYPRKHWWLGVVALAAAVIVLGWLRRVSADLDEQAVLRLTLRVLVISFASSALVGAAVALGFDYTSIFLLHQPVRSIFADHPAPSVIALDGAGMGLLALVPTRLVLLAIDLEERQVMRTGSSNG